MSYTANLQLNAAIAGISISGSAVRTASAIVAHEVGENEGLTVGLAGSLTTRTDANTGVVTLAEGHGITDSDYVDVYWSGGLQYKCQVTAYDSTTISIDTGAGDDLPDEDSAVVVGKCQELNCDVSGDAVRAFAQACNKRACVHYEQEDGTSIHAVEIPAGEASGWIEDQGITNPLAGVTLGQIQVSCGDPSTVGTVQVGLLYDSTV